MYTVHDIATGRLVMIAPLTTISKFYRLHKDAETCIKAAPDRVGVALYGAANEIRVIRCFHLTWSFDCDCPEAPVPQV